MQNLNLNAEQKLEYLPIRKSTDDIIFCGMLVDNVLVLLLIYFSKLAMKVLNFKLVLREQKAMLRGT